MYETSTRSEALSGSWDGTYSYFPITTGPLSVHGGDYTGGQYSGIFAFGGGDGTAISGYSWRASQTLFL